MYSRFTFSHYSFNEQVTSFTFGRSRGITLILITYTNAKGLFFLWLSSFLCVMNSSITLGCRLHISLCTSFALWFTKLVSSLAIANIRRLKSCWLSAFNTDDAHVRDKIPESFSLNLYLWIDCLFIIFLKIFRRLNERWKINRKIKDYEITDQTLFLHVISYRFWIYGNQNALSVKCRYIHIRCPHIKLKLKYAQSHIFLSYASSTLPVLCPPPSLCCVV